MLDTKKLQKQIDELGYKSHGLYHAAGNCILTHNMAAKPSNLPQILRMLPSLPPGDYVINCSNGQGRKYAHFDFPVTIEGSSKGKDPIASDMVPLSSNGSTSQFQDAHNFGRLEAENEYLKTQLAELRAQLAEDPEEEEEDDDFLEDLEPTPTLKDKAIDAILPILPTLADKLLAVLDKYTNPTPAPLAEAAPQKMHLDQETINQIATHVKNMVMQDLTATEDGGY
jgi:hypothetical protein